MAIADDKHVKEDNYAFMTCILRVNVRAVGWQKIVSGVLANIKGISSFRMDEDGRIEVSGMVDPSLLLKMLAKAGKKAEICWWQFGQCSSNLYIPEYKEYNWHDPYGGDGWCYGCSHPGGGGCGGHDYYVDVRHLHYGAFGDRPQPKIQYKPVEEPPAADAPKGGCCSLM